MGYYYLTAHTTGGVDCSIGANASMHRMVVALVVIEMLMLFCLPCLVCGLFCCLAITVLPIYIILSAYISRPAGDQGASQEQIEHAAQIVKFGSAEHIDAIGGRATSDDATCVCCLCEFEEGEDVRLLPCPIKKHCFHVECIDTWLAKNSTCPICRSSIFKGDCEHGHGGGGGGGGGGVGGGSGGGGDGFGEFGLGSGGVGGDRAIVGGGAAAATAATAAASTSAAAAAAAAPADMV